MEIKPMTDHTGAEVRGIDLTLPVGAETKAALNRAFVAHSVLVIRRRSAALVVKRDRKLDHRPVQPIHRVVSGLPVPDFEDE